MSHPQPSSGLEATFLEHRERLLRFAAARGAREDAEDVLQEVWLKIAGSPPGPVAAPLSYLFRVTDLLLIDRYRSRRQASKREQDWSELHSGTVIGVSDAPSAERQLVARDFARLVQDLLARLQPPRIAQVFRRHRIDGIGQRQVAEEFGISLSTVESDLRTAYRALAELRERCDEA